jgi:hypothetical protein
MSSKKRVELLDLEKAVPATIEDPAALRRARELNRMTPAEYLEFLLAFAPLHPPGRETSEGMEPFKL